MSKPDTTATGSTDVTHGFDLDLVLDTIDLPAFALNADGVVVSWDEQIESLLDIAREDVLGESGLGEFAYGDPSKRTLAEKILEAPQTAAEQFGVDVADDEYALLSSTGAPVYEDISVLDGTEIWFIATPVFRGDELVGVIEIVQDRTNSARYHQELEALFDAVMATLSAFANGDFDARVDFDTESSILEDDLLALVSSVDEMGAAVGEMVGEVDHDVTQLQRSADDVAAHSQQINDIATEQAEEMGHISTEVANLSATVEEIASTADEVEETSSHAEQLAEEGSETAAEAMDVMEDVAESADDVADDVDTLQARVSEIDEVVDVINDIAEQTNILALNASIEAARAGEAGEGFAVVADEVKSLAEESQSHASEIEDMVDEIQTETEDTVANLATTTDQVADGIESVAEATERFEDIVEAVAETADGIGQVADATDDQAASAEEMAAMVDEAVEKAETVSEEVEQIVANTEEQAAMVSDIESSVDRLTGRSESV
ncbi:methyl-accepting chemotaxis protein [Haloarculaceae archaeon H-GB2-1]|nr:methyl-accepting chemotaxis protein [Haloarculaceae archaeon H-GB1-1]MEA5406908.1 methyl-accepting chemotaxis protein [Haloarculaceae archaeon H-GB2-1]